MKTVTIQIQLEVDKDLTEEQLLKIQGDMYQFCHDNEKLGYIRCEMYYPANKKWVAKQ